MVLTVFPSGLLVSAAPAASPLPPAPALSLEEVFAPATGESLVPDLALEIAPRGVLASPNPSGGTSVPYAIHIPAGTWTVQVREAGFVINRSTISVSSSSPA